MGEDVRLVLIEGKDGKLTTGTPAELTADAYTYARDLYIYIRCEPNTPFDPLVKEYMRLVLSKQGQQAIVDDNKGYLPLNNADVAAELAKLDKADSWGPRSKQGPKLNFPFPSPFPLDEEGQGQ
jgi:phosphate transport system substrate-binding protein